MSDTKLFLLLGISLSFIPILSHAQCVATQDCETLGYSETTCNGGKGVKCPFGNKWVCLATEESVCADNGFKYTCSGAGYSGGSGDSCGGKYKTCNCATNYTWNGGSCALSCSSSYQYTCTGTGYAGGAGSACDGKYAQCTCASGYEWKNGACQKEVLNGADGDIYKCNGKVVGVKVSGMDFYVAMENLGNIGWDSANERCQNYHFCDNLEGALPTTNQLRTIYKNKSSLESLLTSNGGEKFATNNSYWSSIVCSYNYSHYALDMSSGNTYSFNDTRAGYVRPVLVNY